MPWQHQRVLLTACSWMSQHVVSLSAVASTTSQQWIKLSLSSKSLQHRHFKLPLNLSKVLTTLHTTEQTHHVLYIVCSFYTFSHHFRTDTCSLSHFRAFAFYNFPKFGDQLNAKSCTFGFHLILFWIGLSIINLREISKRRLTTDGLLKLAVIHGYVWTHYNWQNIILTLQHHTTRELPMFTPEVNTPSIKRK